MTSPRVRPIRRDLMRLTLLGLIPLAVMAALAIFNAAQAHRAELARSTLDLSRAVASAVQAELDATVVALAGLTQASELQTGNIRAFYATATQAVRLQSGWAGMTLADGSGRVLFKTTLPYGLGDQRVIDPESLERALQTGRPVVGALTMGQKGGYAVAVRVPLIRDGRVEYVLTALMTPERLREMLERQNAPPDWVIAVLDSDLQIIARSTAHAQFVSRTATPPLQALLLAGGREGTGISTNQEGTEVVTGFSRTRDFSWVVAVGAPTTPLAGLFTPTLGLYLGGVGGSLVICVWLALRLGRRIAADIGEVADAATRLGEHASPTSVPSRTQEIQRLGQALRDAGDKLNATDTALRRALEESQAAARAKDEFLAVLGHELRNPLAPMVSAMYLLDARMDASTERERGIMRRQMAHLRRLVDDLLDVSRITRGKVEVRLAPVELVRIVREVLDDLRQSRAGSAGAISLHAAVKEARVMGDAPRLAQVFTNLLTNALRYGEGRPVTLTLSTAPGWVRVAVQDKGEGMDAATLAHAFEPFYQAPQSISRPRGGLGLGLAIVKSIVEAHGGTVTASSPGRGQGSRLEVSLPLQEPAPAEETPS